MSDRQFIYQGLLKQVAVLDVFAVAAGFVLRVVAGPAAIDVPVSNWLYLCTLLLALLLGTPVVSLIGAVGAALTLGLRGGGELLSLLVLPLYTPILIFGAGAVTPRAAGLDPEVHLSLLGAFLVLRLGFAPWATAAALRISLD